MSTSGSGPSRGLKAEDLTPSEIYALAKESAIGMRKYNPPTEFDTALRDLEVNTREHRIIRVPLEEAQRLYDLCSDQEFLESVLHPNFKFAIPFLDKLIVVVSGFGEKYKDRRIGIHVQRTDIGFVLHRVFTYNIGDVDYTHLDYRQGTGGSLVDLLRGLIDSRSFKNRPIEEVERLESMDHLLAQVLGILFLLIYKRPEYIREVPATHRMVGNKRVPYAAHKTIDLGLFEPKEVYTMFTPPKGSHASPRAHEVIGHWIHRNVDRSCSHDWVKLEPSEDDPRPRERANGKPYLRYVCAHCGGLRSFREAHVRGDASKGFITHDYEA